MKLIAIRLGSKSLDDKTKKWSWNWIKTDVVRLDTFKNLDIVHSTSYPPKIHINGSSYDFDEDPIALLQRIKKLNESDNPNACDFSIIKEMN